MNKIIYRILFLVSLFTAYSSAANGVIFYYDGDIFPFVEDVYPDRVPALMNAGSTVTFRVKEEYVDASTIKVVCSNGEEPSLIVDENGNYSFKVCDAQEVAVSAQRKPEFRNRTFFRMDVNDGNGSSGPWAIEPGTPITIHINTADKDNDYFGWRSESGEYISSEYGNVPVIRQGLSVEYDDCIYFNNKGFYDVLIEKENEQLYATIVRTIPQILEVPDAPYTGDSIKPEPQISAGTLDLVKGRDYEFRYINNVNVGTASVIVSFKGDYADLGTVTKDFDILKADPIKTAPTANEHGYAGKPLELVNAGTTNFGTLLYSLDKENYSSNIPEANAVGTYTVYYKVEGSDNWNAVEGSVEVTVELAKFKISFVDDEGVLMDSASYVYNTSASEIKVPDYAKPADAQYSYQFERWEPALPEASSPITEAATYKAIYTKTPNDVYGPISITKDRKFAFIDGTSNKPIDDAAGDAFDELEVEGDITLKRSYVAGKFSTVMLPFETKTGNIPEATFYTFSQVNEKWQVVIDSVDKGNSGNVILEANKPYIVVANSDASSLVFKNGGTFNTTGEKKTVNGNWEFVGTYKYKDWAAGDEDLGSVYGFASAESGSAGDVGKFVKAAARAYIYPMRAYLRYAPQAPKSMPKAAFAKAAANSVASIEDLPESMDVVIAGSEGTTVIGTLNTRTGEFKAVTDSWVDMKGRKLNGKPTAKGTYYKNGKKVIVK